MVGVTVEAGGAKLRPPACHSPCHLSSVCSPGTRGLCRSICEAAEDVECVWRQSRPTCAASPGPSLPLTFGHGQVHPFVYWDNPPGHSRLPKSRIWPLLFAQSLYSTSVSSVPGSKVISAHPCCGHQCCSIFPETGRARHSDGK